MTFHAFLLDVNEANSFLVACERTGEALLVDLGDDDPRIADFLHEHRLRLTAVFITHDHYDHTGGLRGELARDAAVFSGGGQVGGARRKKVGHGDTVRFGLMSGKVVATPGHTSDSIGLVIPGMVFTGDALFAGSVGGTTSPQDARAQIEAIRSHILTLPEAYEVHPGHGPSSTVGIERRCNPFFA